MKALFRRSQALRQLGRLDQAAQDLQRCVSLEPRNKAFQEALRDLGSSVQEKVEPPTLPLAPGPAAAPAACWSPSVPPDLLIHLSQMKAMSCTDSKVQQMFQILLDPEEKDADKRQKVRGEGGGLAWLGAGALGGRVGVTHKPWC